MLEGVLSKVSACLLTRSLNQWRQTSCPNLETQHVRGFEFEFTRFDVQPSCVVLPTLLASRYFLCSFLLHRFLLRCPARICRSANLQNACLAARCQFCMIYRLVRLQVARKYWSLGPALTSTLDGTRKHSPSRAKHDISRAKLHEYALEHSIFWEQPAAGSNAGCQTVNLSKCLALKVEVPLSHLVLTSARVMPHQPRLQGGISPSQSSQVGKKPIQQFQHSA